MSSVPIFMFVASKMNQSNLGDECRLSEDSLQDLPAALILEPGELERAVVVDLKLPGVRFANPGGKHFQGC